MGRLGPGLFALCAIFHPQLVIIIIITIFISIIMTNRLWGLLRTLDCKLLSTAILWMAILEIMAKMMTRMAMTMIMMIKGGLLSISGRATYQMTALGRPIHLLWFRLTKDFSFNINIIVIIIIIQPSSSTL